MKNFVKFFLIFILTAGTLSGQTDELTILYLGDTHSCLAPLGPRNPDLTGTQGGIARAASVIGYYESSPGNVLTLHSGDFSIGDLFYNVYFGVPELQILNSLGVDAMTVGNHEFDLTPSTLAGALNAAFGNPSSGFPLLSANADISSFPALNPYISAYTVKEFGDLKVGIFGLTTHGTMLLSNPSPVVISDQFIQTAGAMVQQLLTVENCDFIICLSHYGFLADQAIAEYVPGINLIVGGHDHYLIEPLKIGNTWIVQAQSNYKMIGKAVFEINGSSATLAGNEMIPLDENIPEEATVKATVDFLTADIEDTYGPVYTQQIAVSNTFLEEVAKDVDKPGNHTTAAGNFITDAMKWKTGTDIAIEPGGSIAQPVYRGPITAADLFRTVGYGFNTDNGLGFRLVTFNISGLELYTAIETVLASLTDDEFLPQFSGLKLQYIPDAPVGQRVASILINKQPLNPFGSYSVTANELIPMILDEFSITYSDLQTFSGYSEFQLLTEYVNAIGNRITPVKDARVIAIGFEKDSPELAQTDVPAEFTIAQNYPNPFNPSTTIAFSLPMDAKVRLSIYNILGEEVAVLLDDFRPAGEYSVVWNADSNPGGVYLYSIAGEGFSITKKMILLK